IHGLPRWTLRPGTASAAIRSASPQKPESSKGGPSSRSGSCGRSWAETSRLTSNRLVAGAAAKGPRRRRERALLGLARSVRDAEPHETAALAGGGRTNQTACTNLTTPVFADLVRAAQAARAGPSRPKWFTPKPSPCGKPTKSRPRRWFVRQPPTQGRASCERRQGSHGPRRRRKQDACCALQDHEFA